MSDPPSNEGEMTSHSNWRLSNSKRPGDADRGYLC